MGSARADGWASVSGLAPHAPPDSLRQRPRVGGVGPAVQVRPHQRLQRLLEFGFGPAHRIIPLLCHLLSLRLLFPADRLHSPMNLPTTPRAPCAPVDQHPRVARRHAQRALGDLLERMPHALELDRGPLRRRQLVQPSPDRLPQLAVFQLSPRLRLPLYPRTPQTARRRLPTAVVRPDRPATARVSMQAFVIARNSSASVPRQVVRPRLPQQPTVTIVDGVLGRRPVAQQPGRARPLAGAVDSTQASASPESPASSGSLIGPTRSLKRPPFRSTHPPVHHPGRSSLQSSTDRSFISYKARPPPYFFARLPYGITRFSGVRSIDAL